MFMVGIYLGAFLCFLYDLVRCFRRIISHSYFFIAISDLLYWLLAASITIACINRYNYGSFRVYIFVAMTVSATLYHFTVSTVFMYFADFVTSFLRKNLKKCKKVLKNVIKKIKIMSTMKNR